MQYNRGDSPLKAISLSCALAALGFMLTPFVGCGSSSNGGGAAGGGDNCAQACAKADALHCAMDTPGDCAKQCSMSRSMSSPACESQFDALLACSATSTYMCNADGEAQVVGCDSQGAAYFTCILGGLGDGGLTLGGDN